MHQLRYLLVGFVLVASLICTAPASAQTDRRCFDAPGITNCIEGRFREFWEQNGGLAVFGYPITAATNEKTADGTFLTQYFERNRFELHPDKPRPYDVLLGRLGDDRLHLQGRDWHNFAPSKADPKCLFFSETQHNVCNLNASGDFRSYWESHGLQDPALNPYQRSLALFGLPLSDLTAETNAAGDTVITQWFERARFEFHPSNPSDFRVLLGLLGNEIRNPPAAPPKTPAPTPAPNSCSNIERPVNAVLSPDCVKFGELLIVGLSGFDANQQISYKLATRAGTAIGAGGTIAADSRGNAAIYINTKGYSGVPLRPDDYVLTATQGSHTARAPFRVIP